MIMKKLLLASLALASLGLVGCNDAEITYRAGRGVEGGEAVDAVDGDAAHDESVHEVTQATPWDELFIEAEPLPEAGPVAVEAALLERGANPTVVTMGLYLAQQKM